MPLAHEFPRGCYEVEHRSTYFEAGTADKLLQLTLQWLQAGAAEAAEAEAAVATARL